MRGNSFLPREVQSMPLSLRSISCTDLRGVELVEVVGGAVEGGGVVDPTLALRCLLQPRIPRLRAQRAFGLASFRGPGDGSLQHLPPEHRGLHGAAFLLFGLYG